jgi:hypothetical protein
MVVSVSREPDKADSIPSSDGIWLSFNHKSSNLQITNKYSQKGAGTNNLSGCLYGLGYLDLVPCLFWCIKVDNKHLCSIMLPG